MDNVCKVPFGEVQRMIRRRDQLQITQTIKPPCKTKFFVEKFLKALCMMPGSCCLSKSKARI